MMSPEFAARLRKLHQAQRILYVAVIVLLVGLAGVITSMVLDRAQQDGRLEQEQTASADLRADVDRLDSAVREANRRCRAAKNCTPVAVPSPGPAGAPGEPGEAGETGPVGAAGVPGAIGPVGPTGPRGVPGETGPTGPPGPVGADGSDGAAGAAGKDGTPGSKGEPGAKGDAGKDGTSGETGPVGPPGADGATGPAGPQGEKGDPGPAGPQGIPGLLQVVTSPGCAALLPISAISVEYDPETQTLTLVCAPGAS